MWAFAHLGVDGLRLKPKHEPTTAGIAGEGSFRVRPHCYTQLLERADELAAQIKVPIVVSRLRAMLEDDPETTRIQPRACWYRDFNPIVVGSDGRFWACCEMKYGEHRFHYGKVGEPGSLIQLRREPQPIVAERCFVGCKGYLVNRDLERLMAIYREGGRAAVDRQPAAKVMERVLRNLPREALTN